MLVEFAAAVAVFSQALNDSRAEDMDVDVHSNKGEEEDVIRPSKVKETIDDIIAQSYPELIHYYQHCVASHHKHFVWTGPPIIILPRSEACASILGTLLSEGEKLDHPTCPIFITSMALPPPPLPPAAPSFPVTATKRRGSIDDLCTQAKKHRS
jgi:hypothetical protein